ncbi:MAG: hypothetical protein AABN34_03130 [Acidobacteriota bacterium]
MRSGLGSPVRQDGYYRLVVRRLLCGRWSASSVGMRRVTNTLMIVRSVWRRLVGSPARSQPRQPHSWQR